MQQGELALGTDQAGAREPADMHGQTSVTEALSCSTFGDEKTNTTTAEDIRTGLPNPGRIRCNLHPSITGSHTRWTESWVRNVVWHQRKPIDTGLTPGGRAIGDPVTVITFRR